ncbi:C-terminal helicase domain-containing protein [Mesorhizobium sp. Cs1299R1N3]|uniref:C-terminal helicase domain-containing protein n=1 Tax=Mesorhizobium sp. Cs1299R1N3 TaxID=3015173 RepID=UPI00301BCDEF
MRHKPRWCHALPDEGKGYRIFTFTPETSLPGWKPGPRTGRKAERALIRKVLDKYDALRSIVLRLDRNRGPNARSLLGERASSLEGHTQIGIERALRDIFDCPKGNLEKTIIAWLEAKEIRLAELIARFRSALALSALRSKSVRPDLVILDEFHRYADLILPQREASEDRLKRERARVHKLLVDALLKGDQPAVLLLSATPYRLRRLSGEEVHPVEHYRALVDLAGFLADDPNCCVTVEAAMRDYHDALATPGSSEIVREEVLKAKSRLETLLRPLMARTERALVHKKDLFERDNHLVDIEARDLMLFRHLAENCGKEFAGWAPAMWSSIPYPAQTLHVYKVWEKLSDAKAPPFEAGSGRGSLAHPQLRVLSGMAGGSKSLALPWQPPTVPWWRLEGPWSSKRTLPGKTLLFSKWRGAPTSISALLSIDLTGGIGGHGKKAPFLRPGGSESGALVGIFMQWPNLSLAIDPRKATKSGMLAMRRDAVDQLEDYLTRKGVRLDGDEKRPTWIVACGIERQISAQAFNRVVSLAASARTGGKSRDWRAIQRIATISRAELATLADHIVSAPGSIIARCVNRHGIPQNSKREYALVFDFAWNRLRGYFGHRTFAELMLAASTRTRYPDALCEAMMKGGFEAVLDEQICLVGKLGDARGLEIVEQLSNCILDRPGLVQFKRARGKYRVPVQAVAPFAGGEQRRTGKKKGGRLRSDMLRRAFNSPFWLHVLCTTSVGQEGLDFHLWCRRIVHWDLPTDPVDFEQREGRIARFGSLAVRQSLAAAHSDAALARAEEGSPFACLLEVAREQPPGGTGLERWWLPDSGRPESISFNWRFSLRSTRKERMLKDLLYYRLALGQPDPDAFLEMLRRVGADEEDAHRLAIDLSAISRPEQPE